MKERKTDWGKNREREKELKKRSIDTISRKESLRENLNESKMGNKSWGKNLWILFGKRKLWPQFLK